MIVYWLDGTPHTALQLTSSISITLEFIIYYIALQHKFVFEKIIDWPYLFVYIWTYQTSSLFSNVCLRSKLTAPKKCIKKFWMFRSVLDIINQIRLASHIFQPKIDSSINICWTVSIFFPSNSFLFSYSVSINTKIVAYWCSFYIFSLYRKINYINLNEVFKSRSTTSMLRSARLILWCRCFYFMLFFFCKFGWSFVISSCPLTGHCKLTKIMNVNSTQLWFETIWVVEAVYNARRTCKENCTKNG